MFTLSLLLNLLVNAMALTPAMLDHGKRKQAARSATGRMKARLMVEWLVINWGIPLLTLAVTVTQAVENHKTEDQLKHLSDQQRDRNVSPVQAAALKRALRESFPHGLQVGIGFLGQDREACGFAAQISDVLASAGFKVEGRPWGLNGMPPGLHVISSKVEDYPNVLRLYQTLTSNSLAFSTNFPFAVSALHGNGGLEIWVGPKREF